MRFATITSGGQTGAVLASVQVAVQLARDPGKFVVLGVQANSAIRQKLAVVILERAAFENDFAALLNTKPSGSPRDRIGIEAGNAQQQHGNADAGVLLADTIVDAQGRPQLTGAGRLVFGTEQRVE